MESNPNRDASIALAMSPKELRTMRQCLNEVCNGFEVPDFKERIGVDVNVALRVLEHLRMTSQTRVFNAPGDKLFLSVTRKEARILVNSMRETLREGRGEGIPRSEYRTRVGATVEEVQELLAAVEAALRTG